MADVAVNTNIPILGGLARRYGYAEVTIAAGGTVAIFPDVRRGRPRSMPWTWAYVTTQTATSINAWALGPIDFTAPRLAILAYVRNPTDPADVYSVYIRNKWEDPNGTQIPIDVQVFHAELEP